MFAPNRLMTTKEQWLLVGFIGAVLLGCGTIFLYEKLPAGSANSGNTIVITPKIPDVETSRLERQSGDAITATIVPEKAEPKKNAAQQNVPVEAPVQYIGVAVMGAVRHPDLYTLESGSRVADLISLAGGTTERADLSDILLTAPLVDETTLTIPELPEVTVNEKQIAVRRGNASTVPNPYWYRRSAAVNQASLVAVTVPSSPAAAPPPQSQVSATPLGNGLLNVNQATSEQLQQLPGIGPVFAERIIEERTRQPFMMVDELKRVSGIGDKRLEAIRPFVTAP